MPRLPTYIIAGAMRCGTTALNSYLREHPDIAVSSSKEVHFFDANWDKGIEWYRGQFPGSDDAIAVGEATPNYMFRPRALDRLKATLPDVKLVLMLRNPADRAYSHYWHDRTRGKIDGEFGDVVARELAGCIDPGAAVISTTKGIEADGFRLMSQVLAELLRAKATEILRESDRGSKETVLRKIKEEAMEDVFRFLSLNLGGPPTEFEWRHEKRNNSKGGKKKGVRQDRLTALKKYTPQSFFQQTVGLELSDYHCLFHAPDRPFGKHYLFEEQYCAVGADEMNFVNLEIDAIKKICLKAILADEPIPFGVDMGIDQSTKHGLMEHKLFDYESLFGIKMDLTKAERKRLCAPRAGHMMAIIGVDLKKSVPQKWLIENSWGDDKGQKGLWTLFDSWFDEHVDHVIVHKRHIPAKTLRIFKTKPVRLPVWYWD